MSARDGMDLLWMPPVSHRHDPDTSREAEEAITSSGQRASDADIVLRCVRAYPGLTGSEIAKTLGWDLYKVRRRLSDLHNRNALEMTGRRVARHRRRAESEWRAT